MMIIKDSPVTLRDFDFDFDFVYDTRLVISRPKSYIKIIFQKVDRYSNFRHERC